MPEFKVGQKVFVYRYHLGKKQIISLEQVTKITPTGLVKVNNCLFYPNGKERTSYPYRYIEVATDEAIEVFKKMCFRNRVKYLLNDLNNITYEQAVEINKILNLGVRSIENGEEV